MIRKVLLAKYPYQREENSSNPSRRLSKQSSQRRTRLSLKRMKQDSSLFLRDETSSDTTNDISSPKDIKLSNLKLGDMIDRGRFSSVHDIQYDIKGNSAISNAESSSVQSSRDDFVIKRARPSLAWDARIESVVSLAKEAQFLAHFSHEHIINMEGTIGDPGKQHRIIKVPSHIENPCTKSYTLQLNGIGNDDYYLILERMTSTLSKEMKRWRKEQNFGYNQSKKSKKEALLHRLDVSRQICIAIKYLHENMVVFRDLKPDNVGFDKNDGKVKLFDFGLAKELKVRDQVSENNYKNTQNVGTRRYMAPEVFNSETYGLAVDVYSFGILLWELFTLKKAFDGLTIFQHSDFAYNRNGRPRILFGWPTSIKNLVKRSWSVNPEDRPDFQFIINELVEYNQKRK